MNVAGWLRGKSLGGLPLTFKELDQLQYHTALQRFAAKIQEVADGCFPNFGRTKYASVYVLLLCWDDEDPNLPVSSEIQDLRRIFEEGYHFDVETWRIPSEGSHRKLNRKILDFIELGDDSKNDLKIVYYGGHGMLARNRQSSWTSRPSPGYSGFETVKWSGIQDALEEAESDVLLLLDCCSSGTANTDVGRGVTELVAACGFNATANPVGPDSFTRALICELDILKHDAPFTVSRLYNNILRRLQYWIPFAREMQKSPLHVVLSQDQRLPRTIELAPVELRKPLTRHSSLADVISLESPFQQINSTSGDQIIRPTSAPAKHSLEPERKPPSETESSISHNGAFASPTIALKVQLKESMAASGVSDRLFTDWLKMIPVNVQHLSVEAGFMLSLPTPRMLALSTQEDRYFLQFLTRVDNSFSGSICSMFWTKAISQATLHNASIRYIIIALGALYRMLEEASVTVPASEKAKAGEHYEIALFHQGKAFIAFEHALGTATIMSTRDIYLSLILFTCFESFIKDYKNTTCKVQHRRNVLYDQHARSLQPNIQDTNETIESKLVQMFTTLLVRSTCVDLACRFPYRYIIYLIQQTDRFYPHSRSPDMSSPALALWRQIPSVFHNYQEARLSMDIIGERIVRLAETSPLCYTEKEPSLSTSAKSQLESQLHQWSAAFEPLLRTLSQPKVDCADSVRLLKLKLVQVMTSIHISMAFSTTEMDYDNFMPHFKQILELSAEVLRNDEVIARTLHQGGDSSHAPTNISLDSGILPPLFLVASACRDRRLRREAIKMLSSSHRKESLWDSIMVTSVSSWIMEIEEEGLPPFDSEHSDMGKIVSEGHRIMIKEVLFDLEKKEAIVRVGTRGVQEGHVDATAKETRIKW